MILGFPLESPLEVWNSEDIEITCGIGVPTLMDLFLVPGPSLEKGAWWGKDRIPSTHLADK